MEVKAIRTGMSDSLGNWCQCGNCGAINGLPNREDMPKLFEFEPVIVGIKCLKCEVEIRLDE